MEESEGEAVSAIASIVGQIGKHRREGRTPVFISLGIDGILEIEREFTLSASSVPAVQVGQRSMEILGLPVRESETADDVRVVCSDG